MLEIAGVTDASTEMAFVTKIAGLARPFDTSQSTNTASVPGRTMIQGKS
jgi:hypothetical protein